MNEKYKRFAVFCFNGTNESLLILNDDSATVYRWRISQLGHRFWKQLKHLFFLQKIEMNFTEKKSAKFLESKRAKVHVMIILSSSAQCARGFKALWNQMWLKWMWFQSYHQSFTRSSDCDQCDYKVSFKHALKLHTESKHLRINYSCNECDYKPTDKSSLKYNLASQHLGETQTILILKQPTKVY